MFYKVFKFSIGSLILVTLCGLTFYAVSINIENSKFYQNPGSFVTNYRKVCIDGVTYIVAFHEFTVQRNRFGQVIPCQINQM